MNSDLRTGDLHNIPLEYIHPFTNSHRIYRPRDHLAGFPSSENNRGTSRTGNHQATRPLSSQQ
jgi:hypothetical protein